VSLVTLTGAKLERPAQERARFRAVGEIQHLRPIGRAEHHRLGISNDPQISLGRIIGQGEERADVHRVTQGAATALSEPGMRPSPC
jgi:hypothetical protein